MPDPTALNRHITTLKTNRYGIQKAELALYFVTRVERKSSLDARVTASDPSPMGSSSSPNRKKVIIPQPSHISLDRPVIQPHIPKGR